MSELESLRALDSAIEYLTGEYDEEFPMVAGLISLRASLASMTQERDDWKDSYARDIDFVTDKSLETIAALTQERDEALLGYGRVLNTLQFYKQKFEDPDEMLAAATEIATENSRLTQERDALAEDLENSFPDSWDGFMAFLDRAYPVDVPFISLGSDPGPQIVRLSRALATLQSRNEELSAVIEEARAAIEVDNEGHPNKVSLSILDNVLAVLAEAHTSLRESLPLPRPE